MNSIQKMSGLEALVLTACLSTTKDKSLHYLDTPPHLSRREALSQLFQDAVKETVEEIDPSLKDQKVALLHKSFTLIENSIQASPYSWLGRVRSIFSYFFPNPENAYLLEKIRTSRENLGFSSLPFVSSDLEALCQFMEEFPILFGTQADVMKGHEIIDLFQVSQRIWNSKNVQQEAPEKRYEIYRDLMEEDTIGTHLLFEESETEPSFLQTLQEKMGTDLNRKDHIRPRVSTH